MAKFVQIRRSVDQGGSVMFANFDVDFPIRHLLRILSQLLKFYVTGTLKCSLLYVGMIVSRVCFAVEGGVRHGSALSPSI